MLSFPLKRKPNFRHSHKSPELRACVLGAACTEMTIEIVEITIGKAGNYRVEFGEQDRTKKNNKSRNKFGITFTESEMALWDQDEPVWGRTEVELFSFKI